MPWDKGFNFRGTAAFVTDGTNETYVIGEIYPVTRNGVTFGWNVAIIEIENRDATVDRRFAGINYAVIGDTKTFRVDLEAAADYTIRMANGETTNGQDRQRVEFFDDTVSEGTVDNAIVALDTYWDASSVNRTEANWASQNVAITKSFGTTIFKMAIGRATSDYTVMAHLFLSRVEGATTKASYQFFPKPKLRTPILAGRVF